MGRKDMKMSLAKHGGRMHLLCTSGREASIGQVTSPYSEEELAQLRDGITTYLNSLPKPHVHAEKMMQYAKDAAITDKPWELWEHWWDVGEEPRWITLRSHPIWGVNNVYRRKLDAMG